MGPVEPTATTGPGQRHVEFEACFNFRDLGGYETADGGRLRWRTLYRSDTLHRLTSADLEAFADLGLRTVIDLRSGTEIDDYGRLPPGRHEADWHHLPMLDNLRLRPPDPGEPVVADGLLAPADVYLRLLDAFTISVAATFRLLAAPGGLPAVFHCTGGRDRTGIVAALVLDLCGVGPDAIAADYVLTERSRHRSAPWIEANEPDFAAMIAALPPERRRPTEAGTILGFLSGVRSQWGSAAGFLEAAGVEADELAALVGRLVEPGEPGER